jgi:sulfofructose kinase
VEPFDVVGLGTAVLDVVHQVDRFPEQEEVQSALAVAVSGGGPVATAMVTLARLGARVAILEVVGDDWCGDLIREEFRREGVCTDYLVRAEGCTSSLASVWVTRGDGSRTIVCHHGTKPEYSPDKLPREAIQSARYLHLNGRHREAWFVACGWARDAGVKVSFDGGKSLFQPELRDLVPLTDICIVARDFAANYTGYLEIGPAGQSLLKEGPEVVVITDGAQGSWVFGQKGLAFHQPAYLLPQVVDTTGCGDSYHGAFLFGLLKGMNLEGAAALASAVAALNSQGLGGRSALPTFDQAMDFLAHA